ncbi:hypothetical protein CHS0354_003592, partial [Potamilus streckersoni]
MNQDGDYEGIPIPLIQAADYLCLWACCEVTRTFSILVYLTPETELDKIPLERWK